MYILFTLSGIEGGVEGGYKKRKRLGNILYFQLKMCIAFTKKGGESISTVYFTQIMAYTALRHLDPPSTHIERMNNTQITSMCQIYESNIYLTSLLRCSIRQLFTHSTL